MPVLAFGWKNTQKFVNSGLQEKNIPSSKFNIASSKCQVQLLKV